MKFYVSVQEKRVLLCVCMCVCVRACARERAYVVVKLCVKIGKEDYSETVHL
jgi:hypothetical protein